MSKFTHLHTHSHYSLLDGLTKIDELVKRVKELGMKSVAVTDHGTLYSAVEFYKKAKAVGVKPIFGVETYVAPRDRFSREPNEKYYHLILLVQNEIGNKNLCKLISFSYQQGFYFKPRIDYSILEKHAEGLIATTACLGGHIPTLLMQNNIKEAEEYLEWYLRVFGRERFFFEVQPEDQA